MAVAALQVGCYNDFEAPRPNTDFEGLQYVTISEVKQMFMDVYKTLEHTGDNTSWDDTKYLQFNQELVDENAAKELAEGVTNGVWSKLQANYEFDKLYIKGKVQSSDEEGNVYKSLFICDKTGAIEVKLGNGNYLNYPVGNFDPSTGTMPSTWVYVRLKDLYIGNYRMMLSIGGAPSSSYNKVGEHKFYANSNIENPATIAEHVICGEPCTLSVAEGDILVITKDNARQFNGEANIDKLGKLVWIKDIECVWGVVDENIYPSWMDTNVRPVVSKHWYKWGFNAKKYSNAANLYGSVLFSYNGLPSAMGNPGIYVVRTSGYARFAGRPIVREGARGDILATLSIYSKYWADYATYQLLVNRYEDLMFEEGDFLSNHEIEQITNNGYYIDGTNIDGEYNPLYDSYLTPSSEDDYEDGGLD